MRDELEKQILQYKRLQNKIIIIIIIMTKFDIKIF
jgi:hypothetical protein